ncbi:MAG TPA: hypothetical protein VFP84_23645 [Kofleriaceae bacterium]|nr:hypothetical protein [Kofleriaceae bacterium]
MASAQPHDDQRLGACYRWPTGAAWAASAGLALTHASTEHGMLTQIFRSA